MIATLIPPDRGRIDVAGRDAARDPLGVRASIGYQTGDTGLYARLTPRELLRYFGTLHGVDGAALVDRVDDLIERFGIAPFADHMCGNLSTGQAQRVSLARTLVHDPPVLVLDEPTSGLDIVSSTFLLDALRSAARAGRAVLFSSHIMSEVELLADRIVLLHAGRVRATGTVASVCATFAAPTLTHAFLRATAEETR